jgi:hypothetical protein
LQWQFERRLVFIASPTWLGWYCERCCWHIKLGTVPTATDHSIKAQEEFDAHDCATYARENWKGID